MGYSGWLFFGLCSLSFIAEGAVFRRQADRPVVDGVVLLRKSDKIKYREKCAGLVQTEFERLFLSRHYISLLRKGRTIQVPSNFGYQEHVQDVVHRYFVELTRDRGYADNGVGLVHRVMLSFAEGFSNALKANGADAIRKLSHSTKTVGLRLRTSESWFFIEITDQREGVPYHPEDDTHEGNRIRAKSGEESANIKKLQGARKKTTRKEGGRGIWILQHYPYFIKWEANPAGSGTLLTMGWDISELREQPDMPMKYSLMDLGLSDAEMAALLAGEPE